VQSGTNLRPDDGSIKHLRKTSGNLYLTAWRSTPEDSGRENLKSHPITSHLENKVLPIFSYFICNSFYMKASLLSGILPTEASRQTKR
jgi:hypothetical protein